VFVGLSEWCDDDILAQVIAQSQQEYLDQLKSTSGGAGPVSSGNHPAASSSNATDTMQQQLSSPPASASHSHGNHTKS